MKACWLNRHSPEPDSASWDGDTYIGICEKCGKSLRRQRKGVWKRDPAQAALVRRRG